MTRSIGYWAHGEAIRDSFRAAVDATLKRIAASPRAFPVVAGTRARRALVSGFPYAILFTIEHEFINIFSVFHTSRDPIIWQGRIG